MNYKIYTPEKSTAEFIIRMSDMANIPKSTDNADYLEYLKWLEQGNTPDVFVPEQPQDE
jgi:hypothetical protein